MANDNQQTVTSATSSVSQTVPAVKPARLKVGMSYAVSSKVPCPAQRVIITHRYDDSRSKQIEWRFPSPSNTVNQIANLDFKGEVEVIYLRIVSGSSHPFVRADSPASSDSGSVISFVIGKVYDIIAPKYFDHKCAVIVKREGSQITWRFADGFDATEQVSSVSSDSCSEYSWTIFNNTYLFLRADCLNLELNRLTKADTHEVAPVDTPAVAEQPVPTIEQLTVEVKFYLKQTAQNIIEVGKRLIQAKEMLPHGEFGDWLEKNFALSMQTARKFMQVYERFGITRIDTRFGSTQMIAMLALPADETEAFIEAQAAAGTPVEDMTVKNLRAEIADWKRRDEENQQKIAVYADELSATQIELADTKDAAKKATADANEKFARYENAVRTVSDENCGLKRENGDLQRELATAQQDAQNAKLELQNRPIEVVPPADYHDVKNALAKKDAEIAKQTERIASLQDQVQITSERLEARLAAEDFAKLSHELQLVEKAAAFISSHIYRKDFLVEYNARDSIGYDQTISNLQRLVKVMTDLRDNQK